MSTTNKTVFSVDGSVWINGRHYTSEEYEALNQTCVDYLHRRKTITADILASWSNGHTLLADNRENTATFKLGDLADRINAFLNE